MTLLIKQVLEYFSCKLSCQLRYEDYGEMCVCQSGTGPQWLAIAIADTDIVISSSPSTLNFIVYTLNWSSGYCRWDSGIENTDIVIRSSPSSLSTLSPNTKLVTWLATTERVPPQYLHCYQLQLSRYPLTFYWKLFKGFSGGMCSLVRIMQANLFNTQIIFISQKEWRKQYSNKEFSWMIKLMKMMMTTMMLTKCLTV